VDNDSELMDRLYDFLAPSLEQEDLYLIRSPVCLTLDVRAWGLSCVEAPASELAPGGQVCPLVCGSVWCLQGDLGDLGDGEFNEEELDGWEEYDEDEEAYDEEEEEEEDEVDEEEEDEPVDMELEKKVWGGCCMPSGGLISILIVLSWAPPTAKSQVLGR
jgi:hypothetical protein